jgi:hypothetical protein
MKKIVYLVILSLIFSACSTTKEAGISRAEKRTLKKIAEKAAIKKAVESRKYIIKMSRIYTMGGGMIDLIPRNNFIIVNGETASISLGYVGRQYGSRPISGINLNGQTIKYELESKEGKGIYNVNMEVQYRSDKFDLYLNIGADGNCSVSLTNLHIQTIRYTGQLVPIPDSGSGMPVKTDRL